MKMEKETGKKSVP